MTATPPHSGATPAQDATSGAAAGAALPVQVRLGAWRELRGRAGAVRVEVFVREQGIDARLEWDGMDDACLHALACDASGAALGTGRLLPDGHIGRMAVLRSARGHGVGSAILEALVQAARERGFGAVVLAAQRSAEPFYRRHGFAVCGEPYLEAGIEHIDMRRTL